MTSDVLKETSYASQRWAYAPQRCAYPWVRDSPALSQWGVVMLIGSLAIHNWPLAPLVGWLMIALPFLFFPGLEGFLAARPDDDWGTGAGGGCLVGVINFVILAIALFVPFGVQLFTNTGPHETGAWNFAVQAFFGLLAIQALGSIVGGGLGGWIGGWIGSAMRRHQAMLARERIRPS